MRNSRSSVANFFTASVFGSSLRVLLWKESIRKSLSVELGSESALGEASLLRILWVLMAVIGTSFDQWQKDAFFSAAEEVQESADKMESVYRMWMRDRSNGVGSEVFDELCRELHIALGTAKWQLEEFERAVKLSHEENKVTVIRRTQFVAAIRDQISHIEKVLDDSLIEEGKEAMFHWVKLEEVERDELAAFLSAAPQSLQKSKNTDASSSKNTSKPIILSRAVDGYKDAFAVNKDVRYEVAPREVQENDEICTQVEQLNDQRRTSSHGYVRDWKIAIADEGDADGKSNEKSDEHRQLRYKLSKYLRFKGVALLTQGFNGLTGRSRSCFTSWKDGSNFSGAQNLPRRVDGLEQQHILGFQRHMQFGRSFQITLLLISSIILIVPFVLCSA
ncbi:uncharacterized protein [Typha latifolia]|uniref:uncharacterized protein isoform X2 n=1 Tax=Typha latifolia TaxID=4733 RepID=UPI003C2DD2B1